VRAFTHQELNRAEWLDPAAIRDAVERGEDYFNADSKGNRNAQERHGGLHRNPSCHGLPYHALAHPEAPPYPYQPPRAPTGGRRHVCAHRPVAMTDTGRTGIGVGEHAARLRGCARRRSRPALSRIPDPRL
jgi:hypothetical protein